MIEIIKKLWQENKLQNALFYLFIFVMTLAFSIQQDLVDVDIYSRLIMGSHVVNFGEVMSKDIVSYTPTHTWFDHEWLSSALMYLIVTYIGPIGLTLTKALLCFATIALVNINIEQKFGKNYKYRYLYFFIFLAIMWHITFFARLRCQTFTFVFYPILILLLERVRMNYKSKALYFIPFLMLFWLNMHGASMYGVGVIGLYAIGEAINRRPCLRYFLILIPTILVYFINPWGVEFVEFMINAISVDRSAIAEWKSPFTMHPNLVFIYISILLSFCAIYIYNIFRNKLNFKTIDWAKTLVLIATLIMAMKYIKHNYLFFVTVFILMYDEVKNVFDDILHTFVKYTNVAFPLAWLWVSTGLLCSFYIFSSFSITDNWYKNTSAEFPLQPLQFIIDNDLKGNIFTPFYWGGFIAYKHYPDLKIYMDGRQEQVYDDVIFRQQMNFLKFVNNDSINVFRNFPADIVLLDKQWKGTEMLKRQTYFKYVYDDGNYVIYLAPHMVKKDNNYKLPYEIKNYTKENFFKTNYKF